MTDPRHNARDVFPPTGTEISAKSWLTEAPLRMLMNNLHPDVAENPHELVVYGGIGRAARTWEDFDRICAALRDLDRAREHGVERERGLRQLERAQRLTDGERGTCSLCRDLPGAVTVTLALAWFTAASVMHSVLAGLQSLPKGQYEAALTQGFAPGQTLRLVLLPQALRNVQPSLVGIFIGLLKDTSLAFIVNVPELTTVAGQVNNRVQIYPLAIFVFTGAVYYLLCCGLSLLASRRFTRRATAG